MGNWSFLLILALLLGGCSTKPTRFQKKKQGEGYFDSVQNNLRFSSFVGNDRTKPSKAKLYAEFHAVEICRSEGHKYANIIDTLDRSLRKDVTKTDSTGPVYYGSYGMYPFYSRYSSWGVGMGYGTTSSRSWQETYVYPKMEVPYTCGNSVYRPKMMFREVTAEEMKLLVKDLKGGLQVQELMEGSPNEKTFKEGDIILRADNDRVEKVFELLQRFNEKKTAAKVEFLREGARRTAVMKATDVSEVAGTTEDSIIREACEEKEVKKLYPHLCEAP